MKFSYAMKNQRGFILPILIIFALIILGIVAYFFSPKSISSINVKMPVTSPVATVSELPQIVLTTKPTLDPKLNRITLSNSIGRDSKTVSLVLDLPTNFKVVSTVNNVSTVTYNGSTFEITGNGGGGGGPCPMNDFGEDCGYTDEKDVKNIDYYRVWKNKNGVFMINPQEIFVDGIYLNNITIDKIKPETIFTTIEISAWKSVLQNIKEFK